MGSGTIDLTGPHGWKHGFIYVGGPGLPSHPPPRSHHGPGRSHPRSHPRSRRPLSAKALAHPTGKASERAAGRRALAKLGLALPDGGFPVGDARHWDKARQAIGRVKNPQRRAQVASLLRRTAARYGRTKALKESWAAAASNTGPALEFTVPDAVLPVSGPLDLVITRDPADGSAVVRHRLGGGEIGRIRHSDDGQWRAAREGKDLQPHTRQRGALLELIGVHNHAAPSPYRRQPAQAAEPLQPGAQQTDLMRAYGIPAVSGASLAASTPVIGAADGPRVTTGLGTKGQAIYKKLRGRGFPHERAHNFARKAENLAARRSKK